MNEDIQQNEEAVVLSYLELRKVIGFLGIALPFALLVGALIFFQTGWQSSISSYYYTGMRDVLVGTLVAIGVFLFSYNGYPGDAIYGRLACGFAIGVALFPTTPEGEATLIEITNGYFHLFFTAAFFITLVYFSYFLFTKSDQDPEDLPKKKAQRNKVYKACGVVMAVCILGIVLAFLFPRVLAWLGGNPVFWLESAAIWAFGVSWFTKGEAIAMLND